MIKYLEVLPNIYYLKFDNYIDIGLTFWRYQEYYESKDFKGKVFTLIDFIHQYANKHENEFNYFGYWGGFNLPSNVLFEVWRKGVKDENKYDKILRKLVKKINKKSFYFVSGFEKSLETIQHELAHGLYTMNLKYRKEINQILYRIPDKFIDKSTKILKKHGYHRCVWKDELQAYLIAGQDTGLDFKNDDRYRRMILPVYKKYSRRAVSLLSEYKSI